VLGWYAGLSTRRREFVQDCVLALTLAVLNVAAVLPYLSHMRPGWLALTLAATQCLPLAWRRYWPVPVIIVAAVPRVMYDALGFSYAPLPLAMVIAFATVADRSGLRLRWITVVMTIVGVAWSQALPGHNQPYDAIVQAFMFGTGWVVGTLNRYRRAAFAAEAERAERAEASLDEAAVRAAAAERVRIARELHDVVAHHVSLIAVQAEAVGAALPAQPEAASSSADLIAGTARTAMTELRRLLGVLRFKDSESMERLELSPSPSMSQIDDLVDAVRDAGLTVSCTVTGETGRVLPPGVDLTAYRIIQEALTNAMRHAPGSTASVRVRYASDFVTVEVANTPRPAGGAPPAAVAAARAAARSGGYGLAGIAERVTSCGGSLTLGPAADGGFAVSARLPLS
jgi:signal transduction histidine kinase